MPALRNREFWNKEFCSNELSMVDASTVESYGAIDMIVISSHDQLA